MNANIDYYSRHNSNENNNYAFKMYLRGLTLGDIEHQILDLHSSSERGSYNFPTDFRTGFEKALEEEDLFRRIGTVKKSGVASGIIQVGLSDGDAAIVAENGSFPEDSDTISDVSYGSYKIAGMCKLSNDFINDGTFDVEGYLKGNFAKRFGRAEENLFINGTGSGQPKGFLKNATTGVTVTSSTFTSDDIIKLFFSLDKRMRKNACWIMSDTTALAVRKLKDQSGRYLWTDDNTILGKRVEISNYMTDATKPIAFGDFSYYWIIERQPLAVKVLKELYSRNNKTGYAAFERLDGKLIRTDAVKLLVIDVEQ